MDLCFSKRELSWLDDLMPESKKKKLDDAKKKAKEEEVMVLAPTVHFGQPQVTEHRKGHRRSQHVRNTKGCIQELGRLLQRCS